MLFTVRGPAFKMIRKQMIAILLLAAAAQASETRAERGFRHFYNLEYDQAIDEFRGEVADTPDEPDGYNHLAQAILYRRLYRSGILENSLVSGNDMLLSLIHQPKLVLNSTDEGEFRRSIDSSAISARARLLMNPKDDAALYSLGVTYSLRANYEFLVRKSWLAAIRAGNEALKLHKQVVELNPSRTDALLVVGVHDYVVASLPVGLRILGAMAGVRGDKERGMRALQMVAARGHQNRVEAQILLSMLYRHEARAEQAIPLLNGLLESFPHNYLLHFAKVYTFIELRDEANALDSLSSLDMNRAAGVSGYDHILPARICRARDQIESRLGFSEQARGQREKATKIVEQKDSSPRSCG
jgi:tetratricopeptide (TPR) repeat protein